ncbi:hypothetical protein ACQQ2T_09005 [Paraclostridium tenue]|uniref:Uncharacterized protein n=2 Tax=Paeniclostridium hominis TaxID=2764329 RepID=A0ABR7K390_9FIRM|nr:MULTISPECIES: hypothetical protein [Paeniclostridium]MBC6003334.1 hypothetical protein [Paeniclostridium hominis]
MKNNILDKAMQIYFKYLSISNIIFYCIYLIFVKHSNLSIKNIIFIIISSISMIFIPVLYLVIKTKKEKLENTYMYMNIIIVTMCFDILLLSMERNFSFIYLLKSIVISLILFTPTRMVISASISFVINRYKKVNLKNVSN